jgi:phenylalanyl-tRNA synthetase beta chain
VAEAGSDKVSPKRVTLRLERMRRLLGTEISADEALDALRRLQFSPQLQDGNSIAVTTCRAGGRTSTSKPT